MLTISRDVDECKPLKTGVVFSDVLATVELVNCTSVQVQCTGMVPTAGESFSTTSTPPTLNLLLLLPLGWCC